MKLLPLRNHAEIHLHLPDNCRVEDSREVEKEVDRDQVVEEGSRKRRVQQPQ